MSAAAFRWLPLFVALYAAWPADAPNTFQDPQHAYSVPIPPGWTAEQGHIHASVIMLEKAYSLFVYVDGGGSDPELLAKYKGYLWAGWKDHRLLRSGAVQLGGVSGSFEIYSGTNRSGDAATVRMVSAPAGTAAMLIESSCPTAEWDKWKPAFGSMEHGLRFKIAGEQGALTPSPAAPSAAGTASASRGLPNGFRLAGRSGQTGQALTASFTGGTSAKTTFRSAFRLAGGYFDQPPVLGSAVVDPRDQTVEGLFRGSWRGTPVRGFIVVSVDGSAGYVGIVFDSAGQFARSLPALSRQMSASLPAQSQDRGGQAAAVAHPHPAQPLTQTSLSDGSGTIGLPAGWRITGSYQGTVDTVGPDDAFVSLGGVTVVFTFRLPGTPDNQISGPYQDPVHALPLMMDYAILQGGLRSGRLAIQITESAPTETQSGQAAYIAFRVHGQDFDGRYLALVQTAPIDDTEWFLYISVVGARSDRFAELFPTLWAMWKSWSVNAAVYKARMDSALQSMRDTYAIIQGIDREKQRATSISNRGWDQVIRGVTTIQNLPDGDHAYEVDDHTVDVMRQLGLEGKGFRVVSPAELEGGE